MPTTDNENDYTAIDIRQIVKDLRLIAEELDDFAEKLGDSSIRFSMKTMNEVVFVRLQSFKRSVERRVREIENQNRLTPGKQLPQIRKKPGSKPPKKRES